jgi:hypothetical protein
MKEFRHGLRRHGNAKWGISPYFSSGRGKHQWVIGGGYTVFGAVTDHSLMLWHATENYINRD